MDTATPEAKMAIESVHTCDWQKMRDGMWSALEQQFGYPGLAFHEQMLWKSHDSGRCVECGAPGTVKHGRSMLAQAIDHYFMCDECDSYFAGSVGGHTYSVLARKDGYLVHIKSLGNKREAAKIARAFDGDAIVRPNVY